MKRIHRLLQLLRRLADELSDEGAYRRHLSACGREASREEWQRFSDQRFRHKYQQGKCC
jgi:hypothetical protein